MTPPNRRRAPRGARRPSSPFASAALAVPGGALLGVLIGSQFALVDTLARGYVQRGLGFDSWFGFAALEVVLAFCIGGLIGAFIGFLVSGALVAAWATRLGGIAVTAIGAVTAAAACTALLVLWLGASAPLLSLAAYASVRATGGIILLVQVAERDAARARPAAPRRICRVPHA